MAAGFANALMLITLMIMNVILGFFVIAYAAHCFLLVIEETAAGNDEVVWPDEPLYDWILKGIYLVSLVAIWLAPLGILARALKTNGAPPLLFISWLTLAFAVLWLFFPISILSAMSAQSKWVLLRWTVVRDVMRLPVAIAVLYLVSGLMLVSLLALTYFSFVGGYFWMAAVLGPFAAFCSLVYARLIGRLGWLLGGLRPRKKRMPSVKTKAADSVAVESADPWKEPRKPKKRKRRPSPEPIPQQPSKLPVDGYAVAPEPVPNRPVEIPLDGYAPVGYETVPVHHDAEEEEQLLKSRAEARELP
ncbi:MAG TPA: hypothetical protein VGZ25_01980, partial [Gemmataceae bacterium]|nr:hypothetical protein [Gemmataceae bacterium]